MWDTSTSAGGRHPTVHDWSEEEDGMDVQLNEDLGNGDPVPLGGDHIGHNDEPENLESNKDDEAAARAQGNEPGPEDSDDEDKEGLEAVDLPDLPPQSPQIDLTSNDNPANEDAHDPEADEGIWEDTIIVPFPGLAGQPVGAAHVGVGTSGYNQYSIDVDTDLGSGDGNSGGEGSVDAVEDKAAPNGKMSRASSTAFNDLLKVHNLRDGLNIPFKHSNDLNHIIDHQLPARPKFKHDEAIYGDPKFVQYMAYAPECHYSDEDQTMHVFNQMHAGKWRWHVQKDLEAVQPGATIIPVITSTDKTQVTLF
ncbi:hypothetical protein BV25DRAFT_1921900 [Artomyces pyxidatus]|uniref:Uncharacterized protein n=1 Tax=Artomyces pyxidatus TaxID=48021 RepID=A0ACB8SHU5_9AGAM|nr:hypothetical protein BV25DRAFT_1921900 [Artomyces pyxidatus]